MTGRAHANVKLHFLDSVCWVFTWQNRWGPLLLLLQKSRGRAENGGSTKKVCTGVYENVYTMKGGGP